MMGIGEAMDLKIVKHYRENHTFRDSFNALAEQTFGLNFENWYRNGFWTDNYDPYSVVIDGEVAANVSVNRTDMVIGGARKRLIQLGTGDDKARIPEPGLYPGDYGRDRTGLCRCGWSIPVCE